MTSETGVNNFIESLLLLPLSQWCDAAMDCPAELTVPVERALAAALSGPEVAWEAWSTRDDVETALCRFDCPEGRDLLGPRGRRGHVRTTSERAARAVLVRRALAAMDFARAYGGFERCIPSKTL